MQQIWDWLQNLDQLTQLSNTALAELLVKHVWADLPLGSLQSDVLAEVIARLQGEKDG